ICQIILHVFMSETYVKKDHIFKVLSYGINAYDNTRGVGSTHAEMNAIANLPPRPRNRKHLMKVNILVIRTSQTGKLGISKPCIKCIIDMMTLPQKHVILLRIFYIQQNMKQ
ncbi:MAG: hypothetical protein ACKPKO_45700, partial [Candidatus Fonsibacter sp.]